MSPVSWPRSRFARDTRIICIARIVNSRDVSERVADAHMYWRDTIRGEFAPSVQGLKQSSRDTHSSIKFMHVNPRRL